MGRNCIHHPQNEDQLKVFLAKKKKREARTSTPSRPYILMCLCDVKCQKCKSQVNVRDVAFSIDKNQPFGASYMYENGGNVPAIPTGEEGDKILAERLFAWLTSEEVSSLDELRLSDKALAMLKKSFYFFEDEGRFNGLYPEAVRTARGLSSPADRNASTSAVSIASTIEGNSVVRALVNGQLEQANTNKRQDETNKVQLETNDTFREALTDQAEANNTFRETLLKLDGDIRKTNDRVDGHDGRIGNVESQQADMAQKQAEMVQKHEELQTIVKTLQKESHDRRQQSAPMDTASASDKMDTVPTSSATDGKIDTIPTPAATTLPTPPASGTVSPTPVEASVVTTGNESEKAVTAAATDAELSKKRPAEDNTAVAKSKAKKAKKVQKSRLEKDIDNAMRRYIGGSEAINKALLRHKRVDLVENPVLQMAIRRIEEKLQSQPLFQGWVYRAMDCYSVDYIAGLQKKGAIHTEYGFASTSALSFDEQKLGGAMTSNSFFGRRCRMKIKSKTGRDIASFYKQKEIYAGEQEILFAPGKTFKVIDFEVKKGQALCGGDQYDFTMEEIV